jgi:hypothetical protein
MLCTVLFFEVLTDRYTGIAIADIKTQSRVGGGGGPTPQIGFLFFGAPPPPQLYFGFWVCPNITGCRYITTYGNSDTILQVKTAISEKYFSGRYGDRTPNPDFISAPEHCSGLSLTYLRSQQKLVT